MQEDVLGPLKDLTQKDRSRYTTCARCGKPLLVSEAKPGALSRSAPPDSAITEREELCASCYDDYMKGELLPTEDEER